MEMVDDDAMVEWCSVGDEIFGFIAKTRCTNNLWQVHIKDAHDPDLVHSSEHHQTRDEAMATALRIVRLVHRPTEGSA